jgi:hypothetical protein
MLCNEERHSTVKLASYDGRKSWWNVGLMGVMSSTLLEALHTISSTAGSVQKGTLTGQWLDVTDILAWVSSLNLF